MALEETEEIEAAREIALSARVFLRVLEGAGEQAMAEIAQPSGKSATELNESLLWSWPGLTRPSIPKQGFHPRAMDARVKPGHDESNTTWRAACAS